MVMTRHFDIPIIRACFLPKQLKKILTEHIRYSEVIRQVGGS
jgi:hypothetical protein